MRSRTKKPLHPLTLTPRDNPWLKEHFIDAKRQDTNDTLTWRDYRLGEEILDALCIIDAQLNVVQLSRPWTNLLRKDMSQAKGAPFVELLHPEDREQTQQSFSDCLNKNIAFDTEIRVSNLNSDVHWLHLRAVPMVERQLIFISAYNITPLKNRMGDLDNFFTLSPDLFSVIDFRGNFIRVNPAWERLLGWTNQDLLSKNFLEFVHEEDRDRTRALYENILEGADTVFYEHRFRTINGTYRWVEWKSVTLPDEEIIFATARDINSRKLYEKKQKEIEVEKSTNQAKSAFLAAMSHELKTPLNGIVGTANLAYEDAQSQSQKELLMTLKKSADSLVKIVNDILDYSAMDAGDIELKQRAFSLSSMVSDIEHEFKEIATDKDIQLYSEFDLSLPDLVISDSFRITQVLRNLVDNALRFTPEGSVTIRVKPCNGHNHFRNSAARSRVSDERHVWIRLSVLDTGIGISMKDQTHIFDIFRQAAEFIKRKKGGLGIGLTVSKHLVEMLGGQMHLQSTIGKGSEFYIDLPFSVTSYGESSNHNPPVSDIQVPPMKLLVVEDNVVNQKIVVRYLTKQGHNVVVAENGHLGIEAFESNLFDAILMDLQMPEMDGITATRYIRELEQEGTSRIPIVAMTAHAAKSDEEACYEAGMDEFLIKPFRPDKLTEALQKIVLNKMKKDAAQ